MSWDFLVWLLSFIIQAALLGVTMYGLITLSDLENDFINPHDASAGVNRWVVPELIAQGSMSVLLLGTGKWIAGPLHALLTAFNVRVWMRQEHRLDVTEVFKQLPREKKIRIFKLVFYLVSFVLIIYRLVESAVNALLTPAGRETAKSLFDDAAATMY
ncbi:hypothetical protein WJX72_010007 [[Myrmecia] bisecta]|uniref:Uncharacterized protein n=1 Tax=[Myrmecia] bisecta TaxID=41462 RepID=A0AAW1P730_9CHLO